MSDENEESTEAKLSRMLLEYLLETAKQMQVIAKAIQASEKQTGGWEFEVQHDSNGLIKSISAKPKTTA